MDSIISSFKLNETLNPAVWENISSDDFSEIKLKGEIRFGLLKIAKDFVDSFKIEGIEIEDVIFVGSLVNYNWSNYSDIDLHIIIDKSKINADAEIVDEFFENKRRIYNDTHDIKVKGYDVEVYAQDINETLEASSGIYSVLYLKWLSEPVKTNVKLDKGSIVKKVKKFKKEFDIISNMENSREKLQQIDALKEKIRKFRKSGLQRGGEYSNENLVFKYLRRSGYMDKLNDIKINTNDSLLSVENTEL